MIHFLSTKHKRLFIRVDALLTKAHKQQDWYVYDLLWDNFYKY